MATITAISSSVQGQPLNLLDPNTWVGGAVPGPGDTAVLPHTVQLSKYRSQGSTTTTSIYYVHPIVGPWSGSTITKNGVESPVHIQVFSMADVDLSNDPANSGSIYTILTSKTNMDQLVKIDYESRGTSGATYFYSCSIDHSYRRWGSSLHSESYAGGMTEPGSGSNPSVAWGRFYYNSTPFFRNTNEYQLTGSGVWEVDHIDVGNYTTLTVRDDAQITLTGATPRIDLTYAGVQKVCFYDQAKLHISSSNTTTSGYDGINAYHEHSVTIHISGSANYSSSFVSESAEAGAPTLRITDPTAFEEGDIISIESDLEIRTQNTLGPSTNYSMGLSTHGGVRRHDTGSYSASLGTSVYGDPDSIIGIPYDKGAVGHVTTDIMKDELVKIVTGSGDTFTVAKMQGREGTIEKDHGSYTHEAYQQTFDDFCNFYTGSYRAVTVDSVHKTYKEGDSLVINKKTYKVHSVTSLLSQSYEADFTNDANAHEVFYHHEKVRSGSAWTGQGSYSNTYYYWNEQVNKFALNENVLNQGTYSGSMVSSGSNFGPSPDSTRCMFLNTGSLRSYNSPANANRYTTYQCMNAPLNHYSSKMFDEGEMEISGSICNTQIAESGLDAKNIAGGLGLKWPTPPFSAKGAGGQSIRSAMQWWSVNTIEAAPMQFGVTPYYGAWLRAPDQPNYGSVSAFRNLTGSNSYNQNTRYGTDQEKNHTNMQNNGIDFSATGSGDSFSVKFTREGTNNKWTLKQNGQNEKVLYESYTEQNDRGCIQPAFWGPVRVFKITLKTRKQLLLLDCQDDTDTFTRLDLIQDGGLRNAQAANKKIKWIATEVEDAMSYKNRLWDYYYKMGDTNLLPCIDGAVGHNSPYTYDDTETTDYYSSYRIASMRPPGSYGAWPYVYNTTASFHQWDLGAECEFDKIGYIWATTTAYLDGTRDNVQYGADGYYEDVRFWTSSKAAGLTEAEQYDWGMGPGRDDERRSTGLTGIRYFTGSLASSQYLKVSGNGTKTESDPWFLGLYSGSLSAPKQLKLKNVHNFSVGDLIYFHSPQLPGENFNSTPHETYTQNIYPSFLTNYNTLTPDEITGSFNGGLSQTYEITAIDAATKIITLDRDPVYQHINDGTHVYKATRGNVRFTTDNRGRHYGGCNIFADYNSCAYYISNAYFEGTGDPYAYTTNYYGQHNIREDVVSDPSYGRKTGIGGILTEPQNGFFRNVACPGGILRNAYGRSYTTNGILKLYNIFNRGSSEGLQYTYQDISNKMHVNFATILNGDTNIFGYKARYDTTVVGAGSTLLGGKDRFHNCYMEQYYDRTFGGAATALGQGNQTGRLGNLWDLKNLAVVTKYSLAYSTGNWRPNNGHQDTKLTQELMKFGNGITMMGPESGRSRFPHRRLQRYNGIHEYATYPNTGTNPMPILEHQLYRNAGGALDVMHLGLDNAGKGVGPLFTLVNHKTHFEVLNNGFRYQNGTLYEGTDYLFHCSFYGNKDASLQVVFDLDYKWTNAQLNSTGEYQELTVQSYPIPNYSFGYNKDGGKIPQFVVIEKSTQYPAGRTIAATYLTQNGTSAYTSLNFNDTVNIKEGSVYTIALVIAKERHYNTQYVIGNIKNNNFNLYTSTPDAIDIDKNNFNRTHLFQDLKTPQIGEGYGLLQKENMIREGQNIPSGTRFYKVKL